MQTERTPGDDAHPGMEKDPSAVKAAATSGYGLIHQARTELST
jgi:hypothetical protein